MRGKEKMLKMLAQGFSLKEICKKERIDYYEASQYLLSLSKKRQYKKVYTKMPHHIKHAENIINSIRKLQDEQLRLVAEVLAEID